MFRFSFFLFLIVIPASCFAVDELCLSNQTGLVIPCQPAAYSAFSSPSVYPEILQPTIFTDFSVSREELPSNTPWQNLPIPNLMQNPVHASTLFVPKLTRDIARKSATQYAVRVTQRTVNRELVRTLLKREAFPSYRRIAVALLRNDVKQVALSIGKLQAAKSLSIRPYQLTRFLARANQVGNIISTGQWLYDVHSTIMFESFNQAVFDNALGELGGGLIGDVLLSYGGYFLGYTDLRAANRNALAGAAGTITGTAAGAAATYLALAYGSASILGYSVSIQTTALISTSFANTAVLSWYGMGFGATAGSAVFTVGVSLVAAAAAMGVDYIFNIMDEQTEIERIDFLVQTVANNLSLPSRAW